MFLYGVCGMFSCRYFCFFVDVLLILTFRESTGRNNVRLSLPFANNKTNLPWLLSKNAIDTDSTAKDGESIHQSDEMLK